MDLKLDFDIVTSHRDPRLHENFDLNAQYRAYLSRLLMIKDNRLVDTIRTRQINTFGPWSWVETGDECLVGLFSAPIADRLRDHYPATSSPDLLNYRTYVATELLIFDHPSKTMGRYKALGFVHASDIRSLLRNQPCMIDFDNPEYYEAVRADFAQRQNEHGRPSHDSLFSRNQPMVSVPNVRTQVGHYETLYFYAEHLKSISIMMHENENILVFVDTSPNATDVRNFIFVGHNWRAVVMGGRDRSAHDLDRARGGSGYTSRHLNVNKIEPSKQFRKDRRLNAERPMPYERDLMCLECRPNEAVSAPTLPLVTPVAKPRPYAKPPLPGAVRLVEICDNKHFFVLTKRMIDDQRVNPHPDNLLLALPRPPLLPFAQRTRQNSPYHPESMRPVATNSATAGKVITRELRNDTWVLPYEPHQTQATPLTPPAPSKNPHNYETTEGLKRRLSKFIF